DINQAASSARSAGFEEQAAIGQVLSSKVGLKQAIALATLDQMLYENAVENASVVSQHDALLYAQNEFAQYSHDYENPSPYTPQLSPPNTSKFFSAAALAQYQFSMTIDKQLEEIGGPASSRARAAAVHAWFDHRQSGSSISVTDVPGLDAANLGSFLPASL
ncbi:MAG: hypothetical protein ACYDD6_12305, partial [Acidimicrobiales bacterium]